MRKIANEPILWAVYTGNTCITYYNRYVKMKNSRGDPKSIKNKVLSLNHLFRFLLVPDVLGYLNTTIKQFE